MDVNEKRTGSAIQILRTDLLMPLRTVIVRKSERYSTWVLLGSLLVRYRVHEVVIVFKNQLRIDVAKDSAISAPAPKPDELAPQEVEKLDRLLLLARHQQVPNFVREGRVLRKPTCNVRPVEIRNCSTKFSHRTRDLPRLAVHN